MRYRHQVLNAGPVQFTAVECAEAGPAAQSGLKLAVSLA